MLRHIVNGFFCLNHVLALYEPFHSVSHLFFGVFFVNSNSAQSAQCHASESCQNQFPLMSVWGHLLDICWHGVHTVKQSSKESISSLSVVTVEVFWDMRTLPHSGNTRKTKYSFWGLFFIDTTSSLIVHHYLKRQMTQSVVEKWNERSGIYLRWRCFLTAQPFRNLNM